MQILDHIEGGYLNELQKFRLHNVGAVTNGGQNSATGLLQYVTGAAEVQLHVGSNNWKRFAMSGDTLVAAGFSLASNKIWVGNGSNQPTETLKSAIALSDFGVATTNIAMGSNRITGLADPVSAQDAATKIYVDTAVQGLDAKGSCLLKTDSVFLNHTYSGVNLTITANTNGALTAASLDSGASGATLVVGSRVLVTDQTLGEWNGIYVVTDLGSVSTPYVLTRATDANTNAELDSAYTFIEKGTWANTGWVQTSDDYNITSVTNKQITWTQFSGAGTYLAGRGLILSGTTFHFAKTGAYSNGDMFYGTTTGSGDSATSKVEVLALGTQNKFLQAGASGPAWSAYTLPSAVPAANSLLRSDGSNIVGMSSANDSILVTNGSGVMSWGTSLPSGTTHAGNYIYRASGTDVPLGDGGTNASLSAVAGGIVYSTAGALAISAASTSGHFVRSGGTGAPTFLDLFGTANIWTNAQTATVSTTGSTAWGAKVTGDSAMRWFVAGGGGLYWDTGSAGTYPLALIPNPASSAVGLIGSLLIQPTSGVKNIVAFYQANGSYYVSLTAPDGMGAHKAWTLPSNDGANYYLKSNGSGVMSMAQIAASEIGSGAAITAATDGSNVTLAASGTGATSGLLAAATITVGWSGQLNVARGGTGLATVPTDNILVGNGTGAMSAVAPASRSVLASLSGSTPVFSANPQLSSIDLLAQAAIVINPFGVSSGNTGEIRFKELTANGSAYVGFKAPNDISGSGFVWTLPSADAAGVFKSNGSGVMSVSAISASEVASGAAITAATDGSNITLAASGAGATAGLLAAATLTVGWSGQLNVARGGTGLSSATQYGVLYGATTSATAWSAAPTVTGSVLRGNTSGAPTWSGYSLPASIAGANSLLVSSGSTAFTELTPTANRVLVTDGSSVITWGGLLNPSRGSANGIARKWSNQVVGDGSNTYISVTHGLNTRDVAVGIRLSNAADTGSQEVAFSKITIEDANTIRVHFLSVQTGSNYYVVTVMG